MNEILSYKSILNGSVKDVDVKKRIVTGYLSSFDTKDYDNDIIVKGAYSKSINERKDNIFFLNQHNWNQPHGKFTMLSEDSKGLYFESTPFVDGVSYSEDTLKLYDAGIIKEHSVGFNVVKSDFDTKDNVRVIKEIKLYEGSNVTLGANANTPFTGMKSMTLQEVNDQYKLITKAFRNGTFTDETFSLLEVALKQLQMQSYELGKKSLIVNEPNLITQSNNEADAIKQFIKELNKN